MSLSNYLYGGSQGPMEPSSRAQPALNLLSALLERPSNATNLFSDYASKSFNQAWQNPVPGLTIGKVPFGPGAAGANYLLSDPGTSASFIQAMYGM